MNGYYRIVTSEQKWSEREVIEAYRRLSRIEESFRVLKSTINACAYDVTILPKNSHCLQKENP